VKRRMGVLSSLVLVLGIGCGKDEALQAGRPVQIVGDSKAGSPAVVGSEPDLKPPDCSSVAHDACQAFEACSSQKLFYAFDSVDACEAQLRAVCEAFLADGRYIDQEACSAALEAPHCSGFYGARLPTSCSVPRGPAALGEACFSDADCDSTYCDIKDTCGVCSPRRAAGEACGGVVECAPGLACGESGCEPPREVGDACDEANACGGNLVCFEPRCREPLADGATCNDDAQCDSFAGSVCDPTTKRCAPFDADALRDCAPEGDEDSDLPTCLPIMLVGQACEIDDECGKLAFCEDGACTVTTRRCQ
jgi:hypothetical protein